MYTWQSNWRREWELWWFESLAEGNQPFESLPKEQTVYERTTILLAEVMKEEIVLGGMLDLSLPPLGSVEICYGFCQHYNSSNNNTSHTQNNNKYSMYIRRNWK
jgi:hypothetical protein